MSTVQYSVVVGASAGVDGSVTIEAPTVGLLVCVDEFEGYRVVVEQPRRRKRVASGAERRPRRGLDGGR